MDSLKGLDDYKNLILVVSKNTNAHLLAFFWTGSEVETKWVLRKPGEPDRLQELSSVEGAFIQVNVEQDARGRVEIQFTFPVGDGRKLYLVSTPGSETDFAVAFNTDSGMAALQEVFVNIAGGPSADCVCKCRSLSSGASFVEVVKADIGVLASFL